MQTKSNKADDAKWTEHKKWVEDLLKEKEIGVGTDEEFVDDLHAEMFDEDDFEAWREDDRE